MKVVTPEIRWHFGPNGKNEALLSLDILKINDSKWLIATGGADKEVKLWLYHTKATTTSDTTSSMEDASLTIDKDNVMISNVPSNGNDSSLSHENASNVCNEMKTISISNEASSTENNTSWSKDKLGACVHDWISFSIESAS